jgi:hypothetical protein
MKQGSNGQRKWFNHRPNWLAEFQSRYADEPAQIGEMRRLAHVASNHSPFLRPRRRAQQRDCAARIPGQRYPAHVIPTGFRPERLGALAEMPLIAEP